MAPVDLDLDEIERLAKEATPGPWRSGDCYEQSTPGNYVCSLATHSIVCASQDDTDCPLSTEDAAYIAHMHPARVLELVRRARKAERLHAARCKVEDELGMAENRIAALESELATLKAKTNA